MNVASKSCGRSSPSEYEKRSLSLSFSISLFPLLELPKTDEKPISSSGNQADVTKNAFNGRRRAAQHRRSFRCRVIKSQSLAGLLLIMCHRNASSFYDRFRERTHTSPRINGRLCRYVLLRYTSGSSSTDASSSTAPWLNFGNVTIIEAQ